MANRGRNRRQSRFLRRTVPMPASQQTVAPHNPTTQLSLVDVVIAEPVLRAPNSLTKAQRVRVWAFRTIAVFLSLLAVAVMVAAGITVAVDWSQPRPESIPGIGLISDDHSALPTPVLVLNDPSIDFFPDFSDPEHPALQGIFRLNLLQVGENDGEARVGLILPTKSTFTVGGPGPGKFGVSAQQVIVGDDARKNGLFPSCDSELIDAGHQDARQVLETISGDLSWTYECHSWGAVIWMKLPREVTRDSFFVATSQEVTSSSAGHIVFTIPDYAGITRTGFDTWSVATSVESGRQLPNLETGTISELFDGYAYPSVSFHEVANQTVVSASPTDYNYVERVYLHDSAPTWDIPMDGNVYSYTVQMRNIDYGWWKDTLAFMGPLILGVVAAGLGAWVWRQFKGTGRKTS